MCVPLYYSILYRYIIMQLISSYSMHFIDKFIVSND